MNSRERVFNRLRGLEVDRAPNCSIIMGFAPKYNNNSFRAFYLDYRTFVEANIKVNMDFGIDIMSAISDPYREVYDFGGKVEFPEYSMPVCKEYLIQELEDIGKLKAFDPLNSVRMLDRIRAVELYKSEVGRDYPVMGWVECPFAEVVDLRSLTNVMYDIYDNPEFLEEMLNICLETEIKCAKVQIEAGADIIGMGDAAASLIGPKLYKKYAFEYEKKLIQAVHDAGAAARLHICGNTTSILDDMRLTGADIIDVDWMVDFKTACDKFIGYASPCGNFNPVTVLQQGNPGTVRQAVFNCLSINNSTSLIMPGCEVPMNTPPENLKAIEMALKDFGASNI